MLENKNAIVYGAGGAIGRGLATTFARHGARLFLAGRTAGPLERVAAEITAAGGRAEVCALDVLDEPSVAAHLKAVVAEAGRIDVSVNVASRGDIQGIALTEMTAVDLLRPIVDGITGQCHTTRAAARVMVEQGSGVILALNSGSAHGSPMMGGTGPADAAIDTYLRNLAAEVGPHGVRVLGIWAAGIPDTLTPAKLAAVDSRMQLDDSAFQGVLGHLDRMRTLGRAPRLAHVTELAAFLASDHAEAFTGTFVNATGMPLHS